MDHGHTIELAGAILRYDADEGLEVTIKEGARINVALVREVLEARERLCPGRSYPVLVHVPRHADVDMDVLLYDHYMGRGLEQCTIAVAWDAGTSMNELLVNVFYTYFPQNFPARAFPNAEEARRWLADEVKLRMGPNAQNEGR
ncbi:MAG: hypothetical protein JNL05_08045 [Flavobacteriales bacterium]|nr:hypothetical protein [Flavobacteriales bacterium]